MLNPINDLIDIAINVLVTFLRSRFCFATHDCDQIGDAIFFHEVLHSNLQLDVNLTIAANLYKLVCFQTKKLIVCLA